MAIESFTGIWALNTSNPTSSDDVSEGDDHIRGIKNAIRLSFPAISATVNISQSELNHLSGVASNIQNQIDTISSSLQGEISRGDTLSQSLAGVISRVDDLSATLNASFSYGALYIYNGSSAFTPTSSMSLFAGWDTPGPSKLTTVSTTSGKIAVSNPGIYDVQCNLSFSGSAGTVYQIDLFLNDTTAGFAAAASTGNNGEVTNMSFSALLSAGTNDELKVRMKVDSVGDAIVIEDGQFVVKRLD